MLDRIRRIANLTLMLSICLCNPYPGVAQELHLKARSFPKVLSALEDSSGNFLLLKLDSKTPLSAPHIHYLPGMAGQTVMVAEFENVLWLNSSQLIEPQVQEIESIRLGQFQSNPPIFRISIATSNPAVLRKIEFQNHGSSLVIRLRGSSKTSIARSSSGQVAARNASNHIQHPADTASAKDGEKQHLNSAPNSIPQHSKSTQNILTANGQLPPTGKYNHSLSPIESNDSFPQSRSSGTGNKSVLAAELDRGGNLASSCPIPAVRVANAPSNSSTTSSASNRLTESCPLPTVTQIMSASQNPQQSTAASKKDKNISTSGAGQTLPFTTGGLLLQAKSEAKHRLTQQDSDTVRLSAGSTALNISSNKDKAPSLNEKIVTASSESRGPKGAENQFTLRGPIELGKLTPPDAPPTDPAAKQDEKLAKYKSSEETLDTTKATKARPPMLISGSFFKKVSSSDSPAAAEAIMPKEAPDFKIAKSTKQAEPTLPSPAPDLASSTYTKSKTAILKTSSTVPLSILPPAGASQTTITSSKAMTTKSTLTAQASSGSQTTVQATSTTKTSVATTVSAPAAAPDATSAAKSDKMPAPAPPITQTQDPESGEQTVANPQITVEGRNPVALRLKFKEPVQYSTFVLDDPPRYVIDLALPSSQWSSKALTADKNEFLKGIRFGTPDEEGKSTRIVLDLEKSDITIKDELDSSRSTLMLTLQTGATPKLASAKGKLVVIDAGHGGTDPGAQRGDNNEKDMTLAIAMKLKKVLEEQGIRTIMTRADDTFVSLEDRVRITNEAQPDAFVSVHINSLETDRDIQGIETYYQTEQSKILANKIHENLVGKLQVPDRYVRKARFYVINHTPHPAVLAEVGFISNKTERDKLISSDYQLKVADSIGQGVILFLSGSAEMPPIASRAVLPGSQASSSAISSAEKARLAQDETNVVKKNLANKEPSRRNNPTSGNKRIAQKVTDQKAIRKSGSKKKHFYSRHI